MFDPMSLSCIFSVCNYPSPSIKVTNRLSRDRKKLIQSNLSLRTPLYFDSSFAPRNTKNHTFSDTSVKRTLGSVPLFSVLKRLDCIGCRSISTKTDHLSAVLTASHRPLYTEPFAHLENNKKIKVCLKVLFSNGACIL